MFFRVDAFEASLRSTMSVDLTIRSEGVEDRAIIGDVIRAAFAGKPYADGDEAELVETLRRANALCLSLVAESGGRVVGQIAFSPAFAADGTEGWYALGPVAVLPANQRAGIGSRLVRAGLELIGEFGAKGCILVGAPAYYTRFGFRLAPSNVPAGEPEEFFMIKLIGGEQPVGPIAFHPAFRAVV